jgi:hypothetical protein
MKTHQLKERAISLAGDAAGAVADPRTGLAKLRSAAGSPKLLLAAGALVVAYLVGRWAARHDR